MLDAWTILVVEDDPDIQAVVSAVLRMDGHPVAIANNGLEALELIRREGPPRLILLDMQMPEMNGWQFATRLFEEYGHTIPVVLMSAVNNSEQRADEIQADGWLAKPFDLSRLKSTVNRFAAHP